LLHTIEVCESPNKSPRIEFVNNLVSSAGPGTMSKSSPAGVRRGNHGGHAHPDGAISNVKSSGTGAGVCSRKILYRAGEEADEQVDDSGS
jgi:hypothetical protein